MRTIFETVMEPVEGGKKAIVKFNPILNEYVVKFYTAERVGVVVFLRHIEAADYFTPDRQDAINTAIYEIWGKDGKEEVNYGQSGTEKQS